MMVLAGSSQPENSKSKKTGPVLVRNALLKTEITRRYLKVFH